MGSGRGGGGSCFIGATHQLWQELLRVCGYCGSSVGRWCSGGFLQEEWGVVEGVLELNEVLRSLRPGYLTKRVQMRIRRSCQDFILDRPSECVAVSII